MPHGTNALTTLTGTNRHILLADFNADNATDVYVSMVSAENLLFWGNPSRAGQFTKADDGFGAAEGSFDTKSATSGDWNNDGFMDLYTNNNNMVNRMFTFQSCDPGHVLSEISTGRDRSCYRCPAYGYSSAGSGQGAFECHLCPSGRVSPLGIRGNKDSKLCLPCEPGKYRSLAQHTDTCTACQPGQYAGGGASKCKRCDFGLRTNVNTSGASYCLACSPGEQPNAKQIGCIKCNGTSYSISGVTCTKCNSPHIIGKNHRTCDGCVPGRAPNARRTQCVDCVNFSYSQFGVACIPCPANEVGTRDGTRCQACPSAKFRDQSHYATEDRCPGTPFHVGSPCRTGYSGMLCRSCASNFHMSHAGSCEPCAASNSATDIVWMFTIVIITIIAVCAYARRSQKTDSEVDVDTLTEHNPVSPVDRQQMELWKEEGFMTSVSMPLRQRIQMAVRCAFQPLRIVITYLQVTTQLGPILHVRYPKLFSQMMSMTGKLLDVFGVLSLECQGLAKFQHKWLLRIIGAPSVFALLPLVHAVYLIRSRTARDTVQKEFKSDLFFMVFFLYPSMCNEAFNTFNRIKLDNAEDDNMHGRSVLAVDDRIFYGDINLWRVLSACVIVVVGFGVPLFFGALLFRRAWQHDSHAADSKFMMRMAEELDLDIDVVVYLLRDLKLGPDFAFLMDAWKPQFVYWESLDLLRKLTLVGLVVLVGQGSVLQICSAAAFSNVFLILQVHLRPYKNDMDNNYRLLTEAHLFLVLVAAFALHSDETDKSMQHSSTLDWILALTFVLCVPAGFMVTVVTKLRHTSVVMTAHGHCAAFQRLRLGLASSQDRNLMVTYCDRLRDKIQAAENAQSFVQWMCLDADQQFQCIERTANEVIEMAFLGGESCCSVVLSSVLSTINFQDMTVNDGQQIRAVRRRVLAPSLAADTIPMDWLTLPPSGQHFARDQVERSSTASADRALWERIEARVAISLPDFRVESIDRLKNLSLFNRYEQFCWQLHSKCSVNECEAFHYAPDGVLQLITESGSVGFDPRIGRGEYGCGTYFAEHAIYPASLAHQWLFSGICSDSVGDGGKWGGDSCDKLIGTLQEATQAAIKAEANAPDCLTLLFARVARGRCKDFGARCASARGDAAAISAGFSPGLPDWPRLGGGQGLNRPPPLSNAEGQTELYDSVTGTEGDLAWTLHPRLRENGSKFGRQYVTFHPDQSYPEAVVHLKRSSRSPRGRLQDTIATVHSTLQNGSR
eukprot:COSAG01_NODE_1577_length_9847_cov_11.543394_9_plen_1234_part_00